SNTQSISNRTNNAASPNRMSIFKKIFGKKEGDGETPDFRAFVEGSMEGLRLQTEAHQGTWHFGEEERWDFTQDTGEIVFTYPSTVVRAPAQVIGTFDSTAGTWMWAWANSSISDSLARDSVRVREYGEQHGIRRLTSASWPGEETDGWRMAALA